MQEELSIYDNTDKSYKQFTVLRLVSILRCMNMQPKYLGDFYRNVKFRKPNIYVETLSRTMLKVHNYNEVIDVIIPLYKGIPVDVPRKDYREGDLTRQNSVSVLEVTFTTEILDAHQP